MPIRAGRTKPREGYKTAKQRIEETRFISTHEAAWVKFVRKPGEMEARYVHREPTRVSVGPLPIQTRSWVHSHRHDKFRPIVIPTPKDFMYVFSSLGWSVTGDMG